MEEHVQLKKELGELWTDSGFRMIRATRSSISSTAGPTRPASACWASSCGWG